MLRPKAIRVRGGVIYSRFSGTANIVYKNRSSALLSGVLFVPGLGVNLLSGRKIYLQGLKGSFNDKHLYFKQGRKKIIEATWKDNLYYITYIADSFEETVFTASAISPDTIIVKTLPPNKTSLSLPDTLIEIDSEKPVSPLIRPLTTPADRRTSRPLTQSKEDLYYLIYKRFLYLNPQIIRNLYKVITLSKPIRVPTKLKIYKVCSLTKITNTFPKTLSDYKHFRLALIQFDIAGLFLLLLRKNRFFILIIDNWTRKTWVICLKSKGEAQVKLIEFKNEVETEINKKILAARSDNIPELLEVVNIWKRKGSGVQKQQITIASSHQNRPAERNIRTAEADIRALLKYAKLPLEFWDKAVESDAKIRNLTGIRPVIDSSVVSPDKA